MSVAIPIFIGGLGACIGSFVHTLIWRARNNFSIVGAQSRCEVCAHPLAWYELIPIVSFVWCARKCQHCKHPLRWSFFIVEIMGAAGLLLLWFTAPAVSTFIHRAIAFCILLTLFLFDFWYLRLPGGVMELAIAWLALHVIFVYTGSLWNPILSAVIAALFFGAQYAVSRGRWIGSGDIVLGIIIGLLLGWPLTLAAVLLAYIGGAGVAVVLLVSKKRKRGDRLPFGSFLTAAAYFSLVFAEQLTALAREQWSLIAP